MIFVCVCVECGSLQIINNCHSNNIHAKIFSTFKLITEKKILKNRFKPSDEKILFDNYYLHLYEGYDVTF